MKNISPSFLSAILALAIAVSGTSPVVSQSLADPKSNAPARTGSISVEHAGKLPGTMERLKAGWIEGPGYDITYGAPYAVCASRCLASDRCRMIEYYRPEKKCNLYDTERPLKSGGSSDVAIRRESRF